ncbi:MAG: alpha/beta hydrolase [Actinomycetota bacterium]|nr:alpha/beta hydrolase [Actinomycetota bacterium]MDQ3639983.1 alpha/beta hydrolase [Actinomycetota bacterium]
MRKTILVLVTMAVIGGPVPAGAIGQDSQSPPAGDFEGLVDVGGYRLFLRCIGEGSPTVILDAASGATSQTWNQIQPELATFTRVCSYDRAGLGRSDPRPPTFGTVTNTTMVEELRTLLNNAGIEGPLVLVGHSLGGLNMQLFARLYPKDVVGVVLVDATPVDLLDRFAEVLTEGQLRAVFPGPERHPERYDIRAALAEMEDAPRFPNVPLIVLGRTVFPPDVPGFPDEELNRLWTEMQVAQGQLSSRSEVIFVEGAGHFIHRDRPDVVVESIRRLVEAAHRPGKGCGDTNHAHERKAECKTRLKAA